MKQNTVKRQEFEAQAMPHLQHLYRTAAYVLDNESDAQHLVKASIVRAYRSWHKCQSIADCRLWLFKIMANVLIHKYSQTPGLSVEINNDVIVDRNPAHVRSVNRLSNNNTGHVPLSAISEADVTRAIRDLPGDCKLIIVLSLLEGFSYQQIADIVGVTYDTVRTRLHQGRRLMRKELFAHEACDSEYEMPVGRVRSRLMG
jgi:RNA polymerase sigma-70 factor, ECF subfamily